MDDNEISPYITMTKVRSGEKLQRIIDRKNQRGTKQINGR